MKRLWRKILERKQKYPCKILYEDPSLAFRVVRDFVGAELDKIRVDSRQSFDQLKRFTEEYVPELANKLEYYTGESPIFDLYDVENEIQRALERKVELKSGGYLIIDQTEAMTTVDINTGAFVGHRNLEETIFNTKRRGHRRHRPSPAPAQPRRHHHHRLHRHAVRGSPSPGAAQLGAGAGQDRPRPTSTVSPSSGWWR